MVWGEQGGSLEGLTRLEPVEPVEPQARARSLAFLPGWQRKAVGGAGPERSGAVSPSWLQGLNGLT